MFEATRITNVIIFELILDKTQRLLTTEATGRGEEGSPKMLLYIWWWFVKVRGKWCNLIIFDRVGQICTVKCRPWAGCSQQSAVPWCLPETSGCRSLRVKDITPYSVVIN